MANKQLKSAKDILLGHDFLQQRQQTEKYIHHEFQDFAYRIATQLGDLANVHIYMRLAKNTPRHILEKAMAFTGDYKEYNKGKLFMWKLKQLRTEIKLEKDNQNFEYEFIWKRMGELYDELASALMKKYARSGDDKNLLAVVEKILENLRDLPAVKAKRKPKVLVLESRGGKIAEWFRAAGFRVEIWEPSRKLVSMIKNSHPTLAAKRKLFDHKAAAKPSYQLIWIGDYWQIVPLAEEASFIATINNSLLPYGIAAIHFSTIEKPKQEWEMFLVGIEQKYRIAKTQPVGAITDVLMGNSITQLEGDYLFWQLVSQDQMKGTLPENDSNAAVIAQ